LFNPGDVKSPTTTKGTAMKTQNLLDTQIQTTAWWKEPMMWMVVGLPASVVLAGIATFILAYQSAP
jgi:hypothetical protein